MFTRLLLWYGVLTAAPLAAVAVAAAAGVTGQGLLAVLGGAAAAGLVLTAAVSAALTRQFRRPVRELARAVERMGEGGAGPRIVGGPDAELRRLAETFNRTSEALAARVARLEEDRQQLRTVLSGMVEGVVALDADERILYVNDRAAQLLELPGQACVGRPLWEVVRHRPLIDAVRNARARPEPYREEFAWNGAVARSLTVHAARLPRGTVLVLHDTTELRRLERLRQDFVANVSHELKTPLSVIKVCVETLLDGAADDGEHRDRFLRQIARQGDRLNALILDLLSLARVESGAALFEFREVALGAVVGACVERHRARAEARRQALAVAAPDEPVRAWADEEAVDQILENLLDNALKYTPPGGRVEVRWRRSGDRVCVEVADTGIGIPEADLPRIFERFYRVDRARSREMGGTGLGLAIVKHLAQALHGSVGAASKVGQGTTFTVWLPLAGG